MADLTSQRLFGAFDLHIYQYNNISVKDYDKGVKHMRSMVLKVKRSMHTHQQVWQEWL